MDQRESTDVVAIGSITWDRFLTLPRMPQPHDRLRAINIAEQTGGTAIATLYPLARWTLRTMPIGWIGNDDIGHRILDDLDQSGIDISSINRCEKGKTRQVTILVDNGTGQHSVISDPIDPWHRQLDEPLFELIHHARCVQIDSSEEDMLNELLSRPRPQGKIVLYVDRLMSDRLLTTLMDWVDHVLVASTVAQQITQENRPDLAAYALSLRAKGPVVVIDGGTRVEYADRQECFGMPTCSTNVVDSTGAMAVFRAGYIYGLLAALNPRERVKLATWAASQVCREVGSRKGIPSIHDVNRFCYQNRAG